VLAGVLVPRSISGSRGRGVGFGRRVEVRSLVGMAKVGNGTSPAPSSSVQCVQMLKSMSMSSIHTSHVELAAAGIGRCVLCAVCVCFALSSTFRTILGMHAIVNGW
jgi:hypothetical protein